MPIIARQNYCWVYSMMGTGWRNWAIIGWFWDGNVGVCFQLLCGPLNPYIRICKIFLLVCLVSLGNFLICPLLVLQNWRHQPLLFVFELDWCHVNTSGLYRCQVLSCGMLNFEERLSFLVRYMHAIKLCISI